MQEKKPEPTTKTPNRPRLIFMIPSFEIGGAEKIMLSLALFLQHRGYKTELWALDPRGPLTVGASGLDGNADSINSTTCPKILRILKNMLHIMYHVWHLRTPTVIISSVSGTNIFACILKIFAGKNVSVVIREATTIKNYSNNWKLRLARRFYNNANKIVAVSAEVYEDLVDHIKIQSEKIEIINNPVDQIQAQELSNAALPVSLPANKKIVLYVGRMKPEKGPDILLKAFALCQQKAESVLVMVGNGPELPALRKLAQELNISDMVQFVGHAENPFPFFRYAHLFVLPSRWEGFVNVLLEAMAVGVPNIIASNCRGGPAEILHNGMYGILFPPGDVDKLARAMDDILKNPKPSPTYDISAYQPQNIFSAYEVLLIGSSPGAK